MSNPVIVVVGAGPGLGASIARRFGSAGYDVALIARSQEKLETLGRDLQQAGITTGWSAVDITDDAALSEAITRFGGHAGHLDVLHFNPSVFRQKTPLELTPDELLDDVRLGAAALLTAVQAARPFMRAGARITVTGSVAADNPWNEAASLGVQKAALRNLVRSVDATLAPDGIRAMTLTVRGTLAPDTRFSPDLVAEALHRAATVPEESWQVEVPYDG
jgi:NAD(P)-dependent dehydrogenase (short-subunit alcohol dehydrogenase family)